jgi:hypothetical protein
MKHDIRHLAISWSISRGQDTYGYNICRLDDRSTGQRFRTSGGGYDMIGTVLGQWLATNFQDELLKMTRKAGAVFTKKGGYKSYNGKSGKFYGMTYFKDDNRVSLDGACGTSCMIAVAEALGFEVQWEGNRKGHTTGYIVSREVKA